MKIITPNVEIIKQEQNDELVGIFKQIERAGRICYKSEDKITDDSAKEFVENLIKRQHFAMLEHGTIYFAYKTKWVGDAFTSKYRNNQYSKVYTKACDKNDKTFDGWVQSIFYITTNYRVLVENNWLDDLQYICEPTEYHERRITMKFTTNIGVTREGNRHRVNSIAEESTRYCNYTKEKFGGELNIVPPVWIANETGMLQTLDESEWMNWINNATGEGRNPDYFNCDDITWYGMSIAFAQVAYRNLIRLGWTPQQAREVLPLATKSDVVYTAFASDWKHWFDLRLFGKTGKPHPNMREIAEKAYFVLHKADLFKYILLSCNEDEKDLYCRVN